MRYDTGSQVQFVHDDALQTGTVTHAYEQWRYVKTDDDDIHYVHHHDLMPAPQPMPAAIPAPILAAYHKWLTGGFSSDFVCLAIESYLNEVSEAKGEGK